MTKEEVAADVLLELVNSLANDMLTGYNSGVEDLYKVYVQGLSIDEGSY